MKVSSSDPLLDKRLLRGISQKNELAFAQFYHKHWDTLFITAYKVLKDEESCKDIVQEIFLSIWGNPNLCEIENIPGYLHKSVKYKVLMALRKAKISQKHLETIRELGENTTEKQIEFQELNETVERSIRSLSEKCGEVFRLSRMENLSNREIAERLNISVRTVEAHIGNALRRLRSKLDSSSVSYILFPLLLAAIVMVALTQY